MSKTYRLRYDLLMPGHLPIILPTGYKVELKDGLYHGEGGWYFAPHGVEDNKYHWEEIKEENKSNDSFQVLLMEVLAYFDQDTTNVPEYLYKKIFNLIYPPKPQAENKPDWEIVRCMAFDKSSTHLYDKTMCLGVNPNVKPCTIHSVRRLSDGEVFSVGDEVEWGQDGHRGGATITEFFIDKEGGYQEENSGLYFNTNGRKHQNHIGFITSVNLQKKLPPQPQDHIGIDRNGEDTKIGGELVDVWPNILDCKNGMWMGQYSVSRKISNEEKEKIKQAIKKILKNE